MEYYREIWHGNGDIDQTVGMRRGAIAVSSALLSLLQVASCQHIITEETMLDARIRCFKYSSRNFIGFLGGNSDWWDKWSTLDMVWFIGRTCGGRIKRMGIIYGVGEVLSESIAPAFSWLLRQVKGVVWRWSREVPSPVARKIRDKSKNLTNRLYEQTRSWPSDSALQRAANLKNNKNNKKNYHYI